jgi:hypothetical protein
MPHLQGMDNRENHHGVAAPALSAVEGVIVPFFKNGTQNLCAKALSR